MTAALAGAAGAVLVGGVLVVLAGLRRAEARPPRRRHPRRAAGRSWSSWRWPVAVGSGFLAWAASGWPVTGLIVGSAVIGLPYLLGAAKLAAASIDRVEAIEDWTRRLADVLITGVGLEQALVGSLSSCPPAIRGEVSALVARLSARWPTEQALRAFAEDLHDAAGDFVVASLLLAARRRGPGLAGVLTAVAGSVGEEVAARRKVEAERAKPRSTARLVTLITLGVAGVLILNGTYLAPYGSFPGQLVLGAIAGAFTGCLLWVRTLTLAPPTPRFLTMPEVSAS